MFHCDIAIFPSSMALFDLLCIRECGGTRFNWASSDFSLRFTQLSPLPLISPVHDPFIYIRRTTRNVRQIFLVLSNRDKVVQTLSNGEQTQEIFSCVSYSCGKHWFAADRTFPTDRQCKVSTTKASTSAVTQTGPFLLIASFPPHIFHLFAPNSLSKSSHYLYLCL